MSSKVNLNVYLVGDWDSLEEDTIKSILTSIFDDDDCDESDDYDCCCENCKNTEKPVKNIKIQDDDKVMSNFTKGKWNFTDEVYKEYDNVPLAEIFRS